MKPRHVLMMALFAVAPLISNVHADEGFRPPAGDKHKFNPEERQQKMLGAMTKKLNLTEEQQKSVKAVLEEQGKKMEAMRKETDAKREALRDETDGKIKAVLNETQKADYDKWKSERKEHMKERFNKKP